MEKYTVTLGELIENDVNIFDFDYPFYSKEYKPTFEKHFIEHFYFDEIGLETVARFKHALKVKFNEIMPYWNKVFLADNLEQRILDNYDITETYEREVKNKVTSTNESNLNSINESTNKNLFSDTPVTKSDFNNLDYFSNITKDIGNGTSNSTSTGNNNTNEDKTEKWTRKMTGNIGVQTDSYAINQYYQSLRKVEEEIFIECNDLFIGVY